MPTGPEPASKKRDPSKTREETARRKAESQAKRKKKEEDIVPFSVFLARRRPELPDLESQRRLKEGPDFTPTGPLFDVNMAARYLAISVSHLRTLLCMGLGPRRTRLPSRRFTEGKLLHFTKADLDAYINAHRER